jgi:hypothetical protein
MSSLTKIHRATRGQLVAYLESWGFACPCSDTVKVLRTAALLNFKEESANV